MTSPIKRVLIAGVHETQTDLLLRFCEDHFVEPFFLDESQSARPIPVLDAAIICTTSCGKDFQWKVKGSYHGKPVWFNTNGVSSFKAEFENKVFGSGTMHKLKSEDVPLTSKVFFILGNFFSIGQEFKGKDFKKRIEKLTGREHGTNMANIYSNAQTKGILALKGSNTYVFKGLTTKVYDDIIKYGFFLEKDALIGSAGKTQVITRKLEHQIEEIQNVTPLDHPVSEPQPTVIVSPLAKLGSVMPPEIREFALEPKMPPASFIIPQQQQQQMSADTNAAIELLLGAMEKQQKTIDELKTMIVSQAQKPAALSNLDEIEARLSRRIESAFIVHDDLFKMAPKLRGMDHMQLAKFNQLLGFFADNFSNSGGMVNPATIPQLS